MGGSEFNGQAYDVGHQIQGDNLHQTVTDNVPKAPVFQTESEAVLVADVPDGEEEGGNEREDHNDHHALDVDAVTDVGTFARHRVGNEHKGLESVECGVQEAQFASFFEGGLDFVYQLSQSIHNLSS